MIKLLKQCFLGDKHGLHGFFLPFRWPPDWTVSSVSLWWQQYYKSSRQTKIPRNNRLVSLRLILVHKCNHDTGPETVVSIFQPHKDRLYMHLHHFCWMFRLLKLKSLGEDPIVKKYYKWPSPPPAEGFLHPGHWSQAQCARTAMDLCPGPMDVTAALPFPCSTSNKTECVSQRPTLMSKDADMAGHRDWHRECTSTVIDPLIRSILLHAQEESRQARCCSAPASARGPGSHSFSGSSLQVSLR